MCASRLSEEQFLLEAHPLRRGLGPEDLDVVICIPRTPYFLRDCFRDNVESTERDPNLLYTSCRLKGDSHGTKTYTI